MTDQFVKLLHSNHVDVTKLTNADRRALLRLVAESADAQNSGGGGRRMRLAKSAREPAVQFRNQFMHREFGQRGSGLGLGFLNSQIAGRQ